MVLTVTSRESKPDVTVIELRGRVTLGRESGQVQDAVRKAMEGGARKFVIDLDGVSYIDSTGIGIIAPFFLVLQSRQSLSFTNRCPSSPPPS